MTTPAPRHAAPTDRDLLGQAAEALMEFTKASLTVKPLLTQPYRDDPRWSPWTRWVDPRARRAHDLSIAIRKHLKGAPDETAAFGRLAALADEMHDQAQLIAPHSTAPDELPDMADQIRAEVLTETAGRIRAAMEG